MSTHRNEYPDDVRIFSDGDREFILVGTAHISQESVDLVRQVIEAEQPDAVCVELDQQRFTALTHEQSFESLNLKEIIRRQQLATLLVNLVLSSYQKQLGLQLGVMPGTELVEATRVAKEHDIPVHLCDRDVRVTMRRAWRAISWWQKFLMGPSLFASIFAGRPELTEEDLRTLRQQDVMSALMQELGETFPALKTVLIDERDSFLTEKMRQAPGKRIVAVVGAGHVGGMEASLQEQRTADLEALNVIPPVSPVWKWVGWGIPAAIVGAIAMIGLRQGPEAAGANALYWFLANGIPSALGTMIALGHPATILAAFFGAPFTSLTPVIGAGYVTAFVQTYCAPPLVREFQNVSEDILSPQLWWKNRLLRVFLVFLLSTFGSVIGTFVGGAEIFSNLF